MDSLITPFMFHIDTSLWSIEKSIAFWLTILLIGFGILFVFLTPDTKLTEEQQKIYDELIKFIKFAFGIAH